jgi:hypothetical protein
MSTLVISSRFCGPPKSGNGGYVCGRLAAAIDGTASVRLTGATSVLRTPAFAFGVAVRLMAPPPLETELRIERSGGRAVLLHGSTPIAQATAATVDLTPPRVPSRAEATSAAGRYLGFIRHPFPCCFVCGPQRRIGDGLRVFPGSLDEDRLVAAPWTPDASLAEGSGAVAREFLWAALDCTSGFAVLPVPEGKAIVLGELSVRIDRDVVPGEPCIVVGWPLHTEGRKRGSAAAVLRDSGELVAVGRAVWIEVSASAFGGQ